MKIAVIGTGGSIATPGRHALDLFEYGQFSKPMHVDELLARFAPMLKGFDLVPVRFHAIDSAAANPAFWLDLNRAVAIAMSDGISAGLALVEGLATSGQLDGYYLLPATRADLLRRDGRLTEAVASYEQALTLAPTDAERRYLKARLSGI